MGTAYGLECPVSEERKPASVYGQGHEPDPRFSLPSPRALVSFAGGVTVLAALMLMLSVVELLRR